MNIEREWAVRPRMNSNRPITLANLVADFQWRRRSPWSKLYHNRDTVVDWCAEAPSLTLAIQRACRSRRPNGKMHNHQSRVPVAALQDLERRLRRMTRRIRRLTTFEDLYTLIQSVCLAHVTSVTVYDITTRLAAYRGWPSMTKELACGHGSAAFVQRMRRDFAWRDTQSWHVLYQQEVDDAVIAWCRDAPSWDVAVQRACASQDAHGHRHVRQRQVPTLDLQQLHQRLVTQDLRTVPSFPKLYDQIQHVCTTYIGRVTAYDVATRIGAHLHLVPQSVYMHAGCAAGWKMITGVTEAPPVVPLTSFPRPLQRLTADDIEDFLCVYRHVLHHTRPV